MDIIPQKQCTFCEQEYPATLQFFYKHKQQKDGLQPRCKECFGKGREPREGYVDGKKRCRKCNNYLPPTLEYFGENQASADKLNWYCCDCAKEKSEQGNRKRGMQPRKPANPQGKKIYYQQHREEILQRVAKWQEEHREQTNRNKMKYQKSPRGLKSHQAMQNRRRARKAQAGGNFTADDVERMLKQQRHKCYYCKKKLGASRRAYHVEHVVPLSRGGSNDPSNLVIACPTCNTKKHDKLPHEWPEGGHLL